MIQTCFFPKHCFQRVFFWDPLKTGFLEDNTLGFFSKGLKASTMFPIDLRQQLIADPLNLADLGQSWSVESSAEFFVVEKSPQLFRVPEIQCPTPLAETRQAFAVKKEFGLAPFKDGDKNNPENLTKRWFHQWKIQPPNWCAQNSIWWNLWLIAGSWKK